MKDITYIIPLKIDNNQKIINIITSLIYLLHNFKNSKILIKEVDQYPFFLEKVLPQIKKRIPTKNIIYLFEKNKSKYFHQTRILNDLILKSNTKIVATYDVNTILPVKNHLIAYNSISKGVSDIVYPYGCGFYKQNVIEFDLIFNNFIKSNFNFDLLNVTSKTSISTIDFCQFFEREKIISGYMFNENFLDIHKAYQEFFYRFNCLGYSVNRYYGFIWHLDPFTKEILYSSNERKKSNYLWEKIRIKDSEELNNFYKKQNYLMSRDFNACI